MSPILCYPGNFFCETKKYNKQQPVDEMNENILPIVQFQFLLVNFFKIFESISIFKLRVINCYKKTS